MKQRCSWPGNDLLMIEYHDSEWGVPLFDDQKLFEFMVLDCFQAGLSWRIVLHKREGFKRAFAGFDPARVAKFTDADLERLIQDSNIIRNRQKILATVNNAQRFLEVKEEFNSFANYFWGFVDSQPITNSWTTDSIIPAKTELSDIMSKDLVGRGFKFVGSTICYAFMQAAGLVNDHTIDCFRYNEINKHKHERILS